MKHANFMILGVLLVFVGCASLASITNHLIGGVSAPEVPFVGIAKYDTVAPGVDVGSDGLGNVWLRYTAPDTLCEFLVGNEMVVIDCPAEGDTLGQ